MTGADNYTKIHTNTGEYDMNKLGKEMIDRFFGVSDSPYSAEEFWYGHATDSDRRLFIQWCESKGLGVIVTPDELYVTDH